MQSFVMMALGAYRFALDTAAYQQLSRQTDYSWNEQERVGKDPLLQFTGVITNQITLQGIILPEFRGGYGQLDQMRDQASKGVSLSLITGTGRFLGLWSITSISETQEVFWANGLPRKIEFQLTLKRYEVIGPIFKGMNLSPSGLIGAIAGKLK